MNKTNKIIKKNIKAISSETLNGENYSRNDFARSILNYPAMMVPAAQYAVIKAVSACLPHNANALDPFMGSGTVAMSAVKNGCDYIGFDKIQEYVDMTEKNLANLS